MAVSGFYFIIVFNFDEGIEDYSIFIGVIYSLGESTSYSSHIIFILAPTIFHCSIVHVSKLFIVIRQTPYNKTSFYKFIK